MKSIGICFGATTMQAVALVTDDEVRSVERVWRIAHEGNPKRVLLDFLGDIDLVDIDSIAVTGRNFRQCVRLNSISEPEALEYALRAEYGESGYPGLVISSGGETQLVYKIGRQGGILSVHSGNKCASGTGEFFLQQIRRMGMTIEDAVAQAQCGTPHKIAGRCSVFCKSDCTHALNKGEPRANLAAGLCRMMAEKIFELVKDMPCERAAIIGGGSLNTAMVDILRQRFGKLDVPDQAAAFEAYGAAIYAAENPCTQIPAVLSEVVADAVHSFGHHQPLAAAAHLVEFKKSDRGTAVANDRCILGLDVGSTTTKAVLMRTEDRAILASVYLRTNGNPVEASRNCYAAIARQIGPCPIQIIGLGVTGSGRQIAALHALTENVINEIIAHATAAAYFDSEVDTIFEIGGQDAKYTYLTGGVASDYAMNEACSAGTGSFLEESARESLNVATEEIGPLALAGANPPNFTDQCAAFISSDIKRAAQEGIVRNDILAGLVYSICLNYVNRVKGSRPVGKKIFMQGGVCYNPAVPVAMASLMQMPIIVPPDPGLMGAFGVALEVLNRLDLKIATPASFNLEELVNREAVKEGTFICAGGKEKCDRKCQIAQIRINGKIYPFGGICDRYYNMRFKKSVDVEKLDLVAVRQKLLFETYGHCDRLDSSMDDHAPRTVGICRSFLTYSFFPLYSTFFKELGFKVILSDEIDPEGISRTEAAFCLPAELSHGAFFSLLKKDLDYIFLPHIMQIPVPKVPTYSRTCVFVQGEPYYLRTTFRKELESTTTVLLSPVLRMEQGYQQSAKEFASMALSMGIEDTVAQAAFAKASDRQQAFDLALKRFGDEALEWLGQHPDAFGVVLFGRPYNSFANDANMGIPHKVASRGYLVIPHDMLPSDDYAVHQKMFWGMGQKIMKATQFVKERENLFGFFVTNFSCGPDSFILQFFRTIMGSKPSLTLELDQHTADAGIDTRIEAAVDIIRSYRHGAPKPVEDPGFRPVEVLYQNQKEITVVASDGTRYSIRDPKVEIVIPSMGQYGAQGVAAILRGKGIHARALPVPEKNVLLTGRKNTSCKECLPYIITSGSLLEYLKTKTDPDKVTLFFMATGSGPCRLGQYWHALELMIVRNKLRNVGVFTISDENSYAGLGKRVLLRAWQSIVTSDVFGDIRSMLAVTAMDREAALGELEACWRDLLRYFEGTLSVRFSTLLSNIALQLSRIPLAGDPKQVPIVSLVGEIFVRREEFSRKNIVDYLEDKGFMVKVAPVGEYLCYANYVIQSGLGEQQFPFAEQFKQKLTAFAQEWWERRIKSLLSRSGVYHFEMIEVEKTIEGVKHLVNPNFRGECILTVGLSMREILNDSCGIISIGPFGCMPSRVSEAMLKKEMNIRGKARMPGWDEKAHLFSDVDTFPFLAIETDGSPFPQLIEANMEAFVLQAKRVHEKLRMFKKGTEGKIRSRIRDEIRNSQAK
jgi:predicted CoA-substrate-specific enzyme activase